MKTNKLLKFELTEQETKALLENLAQAKQDKKEKEILIIRNKLIEGNMHLVNEFLDKKIPSNINEHEKEELQQIAYEILINLIDNYPYKNGSKLKSKLNKELSNHLFRKYYDTNLIYAPNYIREKLNQVIKTKEELETKLKRGISNEELADALNIHVVIIDELLNLYYLQNIESLEEIQNQEKKISTSNYGLPEVETDNIITSKIIDDILSTLTENESYAIKLHFGFYDGTEYTFDECALMLNVTRDRARGLIAKGLRKLRHPIRSRVLKELDQTETYERYEYTKRLSKK